MTIWPLVVSGIAILICIILAIKSKPSECRSVPSRSNSSQSDNYTVFAVMADDHCSSDDQ
jgi:hypothetical protein